MSEQLSIYKTNDNYIVLVFQDPNYTKTVKINAPCVSYYYKSEVPNLIWLEDVNYHTNDFLIEEVDKDFHELYYIDFKTKDIKLIFQTQGKILDYNSDFVFYVQKKGDSQCIVRNLHTEEEYTIQLGFEIKKVNVGSRYAVFYGGIRYTAFHNLYFHTYQGPFVIYDIEQKQIIHQVTTKNNKNILNISNDFLNDKIPFYYVEKPTNQSFSVCSIYNKNNFLGEVNYYYLGIITKLKNMLINNLLITEKTQYVSDVNNEEGFIKFYRLNKDGLELVSTLQVSKNWFYGTHLFSCGTKFVICERIKNLKNDNEKYRRIFLYDVNKEEIEYENKYYADTPCFLDEIIYKDGKINKKFITNLFLYAHGFQDYFYHIFRDKNGKVAFITSKEWYKFKRQKELIKEIFKKFKQSDSSKLKI